jgi:hypothetical protein
LILSTAQSRLVSMYGRFVFQIIFCLRFSFYRMLSSALDGSFGGSTVHVSACARSVPMTSAPTSRATNVPSAELSSLRRSRNAACEACSCIACPVPTESASRPLASHALPLLEGASHFC